MPLVAPPDPNKPKKKPRKRRSQLRTALEPPEFLQHAVCDECELQSQCDRQKYAPSDVGRSYEPGGIMFIGEGPGTHEIQQQKPFVGPSGRLLMDLLLAVGLEREEVVLTNATLCYPPPRAQGDKFMQSFPNAVYSCLPRLDKEIEKYRPRVIVTLGVPALTAVAGYEVERVKKVKFPCSNDECDPKTRKIGPVLACAKGDCDWYTFVPHDAPDNSVWAKEFKELQPDCPRCGASLKRCRPKSVKCPTCGGRKTREETFVSYEYDYSLMGRHGIAGAVLKTEELPSRYDQWGVKYIVPTYHPSFCLRSMGKKGANRFGGQYAARAAMAHIEKAWELVGRDADFDYEVVSTKDPQVVREYLAESGVYSADVETDTDDGAWQVESITCIGFARADRTKVLVVDTRDIGRFGTAEYTTQQNALLDVLQDFLEREDTTKVFHNGTYDRTAIMRVWGMEVKGPVRDTMLLHNACYPDEEHGLGFVAHELVDAPAWKEHRKGVKNRHDSLSGYRDWETLADYNAKDDRLTALVDARLSGPPGGRGLLHVDGVPAAAALDHRMQEIAIQMQWNGLHLGKEATAEIESEAAAQALDALQAMRETVRESYVMCAVEEGRALSEEQVEEEMSEWRPTGKNLEWALFGASGPLRLPVASRTKTGKPTTSKDVLLKHTEVPFVQQLLKWRKHEYHLSHYIRSTGLVKVTGDDGRLHPTWKVHGARTGRWSSEPNFQNWPKYTRKMVVAPPGRKIVGADFSQLEMRIVASLSGDAELIRRCQEADESDKLNPDKDPHSYVASLSFGDTYWTAFNASKTSKDAAAKAKALRDVAKRVVYGLNYGAGAATVLEAIYDGGYDGPPLSISVIERVTQSYFRGFPGVPRWREGALQQAKRDCKVTSPIIGRHRIFPLGEVEATVAYNFPIQSGAADIMNTRLAVLDDCLQEADASALLIAQVHDAVYVECAEERAPLVAKTIEEALTVEMSIVEGAPSMLYVASAAISDNWKDAA